ncbi:MAG: hypothetical protein RL609_423 [Bacteroidota bacterium]|jgi:hypothetical protein
MKVIIILITVVIFAIFMIQAITEKSSNKIEQYAYVVERVIRDVEIRQYEDAVFSSVKLNDSTYANSANQGFRILAGYIFGGNDKGQSIAMTSPVVMEMGKEMKMSFMVPSAMNMDSLPQPNDGRVYQEKVKGSKMAVIRFGGWASDEKIEEQKKKLIDVLNDNGLSYEEPFLYMGYNPPYQLVNRRNEVGVRVRN